MKLFGEGTSIRANGEGDDVFSWARSLSPFNSLRAYGFSPFVFVCWSSGISTLGSWLNSPLALSNRVRFVVIWLTQGTKAFVLVSCFLSGDLTTAISYSLCVASNDVYLSD